MLKKLVLLCIAAMPFMSFAQTGVKLGHLDVQLLQMSMPEVAEVDSAMKKTSDQYETELRRMQDEIARKVDEYKQNSATWDETIKQNREEEIQTLQTRVQNYYQNAQQLLQKKQESLLTPIRDKMHKAIDEVAKENGFLYIFDTQALIYKSDSAVDVTNLVLKKLGIKAAAAPAIKK